MTAWLATMGWMAACALGFIGLGALVREALSARGADPWVSFWWGVVAAMPLCALWHLALPIDGATALFLCSLSAAGWWRQGRQLVRRTRVLWLRRRAVVVAFLALWAALPWLSLQPMTCVDSGHYFFAATEWHRSYAALPGLQAVNPLAVFNTGAFFLFTVVGVGPFARDGSLVFNALLTWWGAAFVFTGVYALTRRWSLPAFAAVLAAAAGLDASLTDRMSCPSADLGVGWLGAVAVAFAARRARDVLPFLALCLMFKTSMLPQVLALGLWWLAHRRWPSLAGWLFVGAGWLAFLANNVIVSGYPLYPLGALRFDFDWALPPPLVAEVNAIIRGYARHDGVIGGDLFTRISRLFLMNRAVLLPATLFTLGVLAALVRRVSWRRWWPVVACVVGGAAWWWLAPDPRFAGALLWFSGAVALSVATAGLEPDALLRRTVAVAALLLWAGDVPLTSLPPVPTARPTRPTNDADPLITLHDGTRILDCSPVSGVHPWCWSVPSLATFPEGIHLRRPPDVSAGFAVPPEARLPEMVMTP